MYKCIHQIITASNCYRMGVSSESDRIPPRASFLGLLGLRIRLSGRICWRMIFDDHRASKLLVLG
uniref:Uncharacterized protein n=1 Tax=Kalanchoe fedtschenkoi TaxID=63787 RepID=A0A7N0UK32_KALFE